MSEDEGTNADAQAVPSEEQSDDVAEGDEHSASQTDHTGVAEETEDSAASESDTEAVADDSTEGEIHLDPSLSPALSESVADISEAETSEEVDRLLEDAIDREEDLAGRIEEQAETIGELQAALEERDGRLEEAEAEIEDLQSRLKRKQADFQNYKKRAKKRQEQMKERATEDLVERLVGVRDNLKRALEEESGDVESLRDGVDMTLREFDRILEDENVTEIDPEPGAEVDPQRHEVMMNVDSNQPEGTVADVFTPGYEMGEKVIQNAQITVSNGEFADESDENGAEASGATDDETPSGSGDDEADAEN
ncbi:nucleotide exchange factor GrpE [Halostagnicola sp. A-GB9-2]|uniref:nucleotide exchange factor GrpE n=1 Tax=Halostagnicola sp. A-GB9-2 TaxID=3048066 RepID=UPI0024BFA61E|nr:nucleotide exchange factor GrpE [Halostagnicola sp. A-GB9-2]MDJ1431655.1 nucleotide exchange factor GrpE [Halostagnicola sp. A-GB9-2]